jgi:hypothetical protein
MKNLTRLALAIGLLAVLVWARSPARRDSRRQTQAVAQPNAPAGTVILHGGYDTDPRDHGRPVSLIAAALGVGDEVFRQAFSGVSPSRWGAPSPLLARANKKVLLDALGRHGVTNERLDEVSNYYRYNGSAGETWKHSAATAAAIIADGKVTGFTITNAGAGYLMAPKVSVVGYGDIEVQATIEFSDDFKTNGRVTSLSVLQTVIGGPPDGL